MERVEAWSGGPHGMVTCTSRVDGTNSSRQVYACHEQFARAAHKIPQLASEETKCRSRNQYEEEGSKEGYSPTGWRQRPLREMPPPVIHIKRYGRLPSTPRESHTVRKKRQCSKRNGSGSQRRKSPSTAGQMRG